MTLLELYESLQGALQGGSLTIGRDTAQAACLELLTLAGRDELVAEGAEVRLYGDCVAVSGAVGLLPYTRIGRGQLTLTFSKDKQEQAFSCEAKLAVAGCGTLKDFLGQLPASKIRGTKTDCLFSEFILRYPTLWYSSQRVEGAKGAGWELSGIYSPPKGDERWQEYAGLFSGDAACASFQGMITRRGRVEIDFLIHRELSLPFGTAFAKLAMRTMYGDDLLEMQYCAKAYLLYELPLASEGQTLGFQSELFVGERYQSAAVFCEPPLSLQSIAGFMQEMLQLGPERLLLPEHTALSAFGLSQLQIAFEKKGDTIFDGLDMARIYSAFSLGTPLALRIPGLTLEQFWMIWEVSWDDKKHSFVTLSAFAKAALVVGPYRLTGSVTGNFPAMDFSGSLTLEKKLTLTELAAGYGVALPSGWQGEYKELAEITVAASARNRMLRVEASVSDVIALPVGSAVFSLERLRVNVQILPEKKNFGIEGILEWKQEDEAFAFSLAARYVEQSWSFQGGLFYGRVRIGSLLRQLFSVKSVGAVADMELDDLSISYSMADQKFTLYASCEVSGIEVFGVRPRLGGRVRLEKARQLSASLAMYVEMDAFCLLVQANDFYDEARRSFIFRVAFRNRYIQAVYQKTQEGETLTISLGNMTFGDVLLALLHLVNPNAVQTLSAPWNVLHGIKLSDFLLVYNITNKTVSFLYHLNWKLVGFLELEDIGLSYSKEEGVRYVLTGRLFNETQTRRITWDALYEEPPAQAVDSEVKVQIFYIGIGNHLELSITQHTIPDILDEIKQQLVPAKDVPSVGFRQDAGWLFGFDLKLSDLFRIRALLYSPKLYGAILEVEASEKSPLAMFNGLLFELFYKKISDSTGMFHCRMVVPERFADVELGMLAVHLGEFLLEVYTNGSFYLDLGFPHKQDFSRSFGLSFGLFGGKGGFYFGTFTGDAVQAVPAAANGIFSPVVKMGIGLSIGLMRSFDLGIVKGGVSLTMTGIFEGTFAVYKPKKQSEAQAFYYRVRAVAGVYGSLFLSVDLKIITVSATASIAAFCEVELESYRKAVVALDLDLKLCASIKIIFFKIHFSFHFHERAVFTFGEDQTAPWEAAPRHLAAGKNTARILADPCIKTGQWKITPVISPMFSVDFSGKAQTLCLAFLPVIRREEMQSILTMLLYWIFAHIEGGEITAEDMEQITDKGFADSLTYERLLQLLSANLTVTPRLADLDGQEPEEQGTIFPMLPQLILTVDGAELDFGRARINEADMEEISRYFYRLNADPVYALSRERRAAGGKLPLCGALLTDWFRMALEELQGRMGALFESVPVCTASLETVVNTYGGKLETILAEQPQLQLFVPVIPKHPMIVSQGDSLQKIAERIAVEIKNGSDSAQELLWDAVKEESVFCEDIQPVYSGYQFDNQSAGLTLLQLSAVFYVRLFDPYVLYTPYAQYLLENNPVDLEWECRQPGAQELKLPDGIYTALSGDTVISVAKMLYLLDHLAESDTWISFRNAWIQCNGKEPGEKPDSCQIPKGYPGRIKGSASSGRLFRVCYPDFREDPWAYPLWRAEALRPMSVITLDHAGIERTAAVSELLKCYPMSSLVLAVEEYGAQLAKEQEVVIKKPCRIPKAELEKRIITESAAEQTGAILSRAFLQGARPPAPFTQKETPLYQLLGQQIPWRRQASQLTVSIRCQDDSAEWIAPDTEQRVWTHLERFMPSRELIRPDGPVQLPSMHSHGKRWLIADGEEVLNSQEAERIVRLPRDCIEYIRACGELPQLERADTKPRFCTLLSLEIQKQSAGIYGMYGAAASDRELLYQLTGADVSRCRLFYVPSKLEADKTGLAQLFFESCLLIQTHFSKETHSGFANGRKLESENENAYIAAITDTGPDACGKFLTMLWECSVVGGGFWLCHDKASLPDTVFDENGRGQLVLLAEYPDAHPCADVVNALSLSDKNASVVLSGARETVYDPVFPRGCVGFQLTCPQSEEGTAQSLYQILGYRVYDRLRGAYVESAPILPAEEAQGRLSYQAAVPLWKLEEPEGNFYSAIGKQFTLYFELRDVLGNTAAVENGGVLVTGEYNDNLIALHELPDTRFCYCFVCLGDQIAVKITGEYTGVQEKAVRYAGGAKAEMEEAARQIDHAKADMAEIARQQHGCTDIRLSARVSLLEQVYELDEASCAALRAYENALCQNLSKGIHTPLAPIEIVLPIQGSLPREIVPLAVCLTITREGAQSVSEQVTMADSVISADPDPNRFAEGFAKAFQSGYKLAYDSTQAYYYVPVRNLIGKIRIAPYTYQTAQGKIRSPELAAFTPFANELITRDVEVTDSHGKKQVQSLIHVDANVWEQQFLSDIENLLQAELAAKAARRCPDGVRQLADAKKGLAARLAKRLLPIRRECADIPMAQAQAFAEDRLLRDLRFACEPGVMLIYHVGIGDGGSEQKELLRLEAGVAMPHLLFAGKVSSQSDIFCLFLTGSPWNEKEERTPPQVCLSALEYDIVPAGGGYERSKWLQFAKPMTDQDADVSLDLGIDADILCPRRECPLPPVIQGQSYEANRDELLYWDWSGEFSCGAYEQYTVCVRLDFSQQKVKVRRKERDTFAVMADYFCKREQLWKDLQTEDNFQEAYQTIAELADAFAEGQDYSAVRQPKSRSVGQSVEVQVTMCFDQEGKPQYMVLPSYESEHLLKTMGAHIGAVEPVSGSREEGTVTFRLLISHLSVYACGILKTSAWIIQNDNLLLSAGQAVREAFIFRTETVSAADMRVSIEYHEPVGLTGETLEQALLDMWDRLQLSEQAAVSVSAFFRYRIHGSGGELYGSIPVTFEPDAKMGRFLENLSDWCRSHAYFLSLGGKFCFEAAVYQADENMALVYARFEKECGGIFAE